ncbi:hypothetical protein [Streptomonospora salina]|uniref:ABC-2 type transporter domain-containing protein n=1 Tax=Streptomonospora salina TaxID=104205 RepID=A0A841ECM5_9ACTN|nr:hypothetical protein [Streptomonospora salina]MBB6000895.1 hypothetical protein [Streptomonospora salina]
MSLLTGTGAVFVRDTRSTLRTPWPCVESIADRLLLLSGPLVAALGGIPGIPAGCRLQWFVPGMLVLMVFTTSAFIGAGIQEERGSGELERILITPVNRFALLAGRVVAVVALATVPLQRPRRIAAPATSFGLQRVHGQDCR